jgi:hypothetical protein
VSGEALDDEKGKGENMSSKVRCHLGKGLVKQVELQDLEKCFQETDDLENLSEEELLAYEQKLNQIQMEPPVVSHSRQNVLSHKRFRLFKGASVVAAVAMAFVVLSFPEEETSSFTTKGTSLENFEAQCDYLLSSFEEENKLMISCSAYGFLHMKDRQNNVLLENIEIYPDTEISIPFELKSISEQEMLQIVFTAEKLHDILDLSKENKAVWSSYTPYKME